MIVSFLETEDHDFALVDVTLYLCTDERAILQHVEANLRLFLGEWFLDKREGVPYFEHVFVKNPDVPLVRSLLVSVIEATPGVVGVDAAEFTYDPSVRTLYMATSFTVDGGATVTLNMPFILGDR